LAGKIKDAAGDNLLSLILYGSAATNEFHEGHSDLNILAVMRSLTPADLTKLHDPAKWWAKKGHPAPLFFTRDELLHSADIFAIELLDIKAAHRVLDGGDVMASLEVPMNLHRLQVERELRNNTLRLRQHYLRHPTDAKRTLGLMTDSVSTFAALFRHALMALGEEPPAAKRDVFARLGAALGFDPAPFQAVLDIREGRQRPRDVDVQSVLGAYLSSVETVAEEVDKRLAAPPVKG